MVGVIMARIMAALVKHGEGVVMIGVSVALWSDGAGDDCRGSCCRGGVKLAYSRENGARMLMIVAAACCRQRRVLTCSFSRRGWNYRSDLVKSTVEIVVGALHHRSRSWEEWLARNGCRGGW